MIHSKNALFFTATCLHNEGPLEQEEKENKTRKRAPPAPPSTPTKKGAEKK